MPSAVPGRARLAVSLWVLAAAATASPLAVGDLTELPLEQLLTLEVTTASKFSQPLSEAPSAVTVITAEDIRAYGYRTLADILRAVRGLYVSYDRNYSYIGARGFARPGDYNTRILLLLDGYRLNEGVYDGAYVGSEFILDVDLIERVEFAPGPGSAIYGGNALFGVVNVITREGKSMGGTEVAASAASADTGAGRVSYGEHTAGGLDVLLSATGFASGGRDLYFPEFDDPVSNHGLAVNLDGDRGRQFFGKFSYRNLTLETGYSSRTKDIPTASFFQVFNQPGARTTDSQYFLSAGYDQALGPELEMQLTAHYGKYLYEGQYMYPAANIDVGYGDWWGTELRLLSTVIARHRLLAGGEYRHVLHRDQENYDADGSVINLWDSRSKRSYALYLQDEWTVTDGTIVNIGVRHDGSDEDEGATNPRFGLIQKLADRTTAKLLYGSAFRPPNTYEQYYVTDAINYKANPDLRSETVRTAELVFEHYFQKDFRTTASLFSYRIEDLIGLMTDPADGMLVFQNVARVAARGVELELERRWAGGASVRASYSWQDAEDETTGLWLVNSPRQLAKLNVASPPLGGWLRVGVELQYVGKRLTPFGKLVEDYTVANLTLRTDRLANGLEVSASVYNLFDNDYGDPPSEEHVDSLGRNLDRIAQDPRNFRLKFTYRF